MDYNLRIFLSHLINVSTENRIINGREQTCLILPVEDNQLRKGKWGNWILALRMLEQPPNPKGHSHKIALQWKDNEALEKAYQTGIVKQTARMGCATAFDPAEHKELLNANVAEENELCGEIILSDIPKNLVIRNYQNKMRYIHSLKLKSLRDDAKVWMGSICVDLIPKHHILEYPDSGKKYVKVRFRKLRKIDLYMNTHILVIDSDGSEIEIGRFREFHKKGEPVKNGLPPEEIHDTPVNQRQPESIDGLRF